MGRKKKKVVQDEEEHFDWPFEISIKLSRHKPKIAFLSGCERGYYPEDAGNSRFALAYGYPETDDNAGWNFTPSTNLLNKPVSTLGYGMGGLLGPRFPTESGIDNPAPNAYQDFIVPRRVKAKEKKKRIKWNDFVRRYEAIVEQQYAKWEADQNLLDEMTRKKLRKSTDMPTGQTFHPKKLSKEKDAISGEVSGKTELQLIDKMCHGKSSAFGMSLSRPRFERDTTYQNAGVGTYNWSEPLTKRSYLITNSEGKLIPRVRMNCLPDSCDTCMNCGLELRESDYYQTRSKYRVVNKVDPMTYGKFKYAYLSFCRKCYCHALKNGHEPWTKDKIPWLFMKARHCHAVHDHKEGHTEFLTRATCKSVNYLSRKEIMYHRFFKDEPCQKT